ncbi:MAG: helix-turn-helix transcriptional regulator [Gloeocapsa sp. UFS-A4-WI-NPMV-4B04]|jgi:transcriptional regulator with XRE-family HTH domain|nr:helix-turn-helix transcriptional regulator [Gloeocapsa sp. UFS-A4-WI-NPMV-4B04]
MNPKAKRLATFIQELRGSQSQRQLAKQLGVSQGSVNLWESGQSLPDTENLDKLAALRGWSLSDLQAYLVKGDLPDREPLEHILNTVRSLPLEAVAQVAAVAVETLANRSISNQTSRKSVHKAVDPESALSA